MQADLQNFLRTRWRRHAVCFGIWTLLAVLSAVEAYVSQSVLGPPISWGLAFRRAFEEWYPWAVLSIGVIWIANRVQFEPGRLTRWFVVHGIASAIAAAIYVVVFAWLMAGQRSVQDGSILTFEKVFRKAILHYSLFNVTMYWMVLVAHHGWVYYQRYRERERQAGALATELVRARLELLRMQLNPHFLFNTLHTISAFIHENPDRADRMVARLSELLRRTLDLGEAQEVRLREELAFLEGYLEIERMRFEDRLAVELQVEPGVEEMLVPSLILQPLVENAIRHGIEPREDPGRVRISARRADGMLELKVSDNGPGLPEVEAAPTREGVGLSNTRSRLAHLYGAKHKFDLTSAPGGGFEVRLLIPCRTEATLYAPRVMIVSPADAGSPVACPVPDAKASDCC